MKSTADFLYCIGLTKESFVLYVLLLRRLMEKSRHGDYQDQYATKQHNDALIRAGISCAFSATTKPQIEVFLNLHKRLLKEQFTREEDSILYHMLFCENHKTDLADEDTASPSQGARGSTILSEKSTEQHFRALQNIYSAFSTVKSEANLDYMEWEGSRPRACVMWCKAILEKQTFKALSQSALHLSDFCLRTGRRREFLYCYLWQCYLMEDSYAEYGSWKDAPWYPMKISACELLLIVTDMICKNCPDLGDEEKNLLGL
jgi:hypothetical protein